MTQEETGLRFVGAWRLLSCEARDLTGQTFYPFGETRLINCPYDAAYICPRS